MPEVPEAKEQEDVVAAAREVVEHGGGLMYREVLLDLSTAEAIVRVAGELEPDRLERMRSMDVHQVAAICRKLVGS